MQKGRTVMAYDRPGGQLIRVFQVGIEDPVEAVETILLAYPELDQVYLQAAAQIDATSVAFAELEPGEVRVENVIRTA